jgi:putative tryptophan/tyrosine transport system substrate-binding protein
MMDRRAFTAGAVAALLAAAPSASTQPAGRVYRLGILSPAKAPDPSILTSVNLAPIALRELGYVEGQNLAIERRFAEDRPERLPALARELVQRHPDVILAQSGPAVQAARAATSTVPIVMVSLAGDPVQRGYVQSLARPGGNITGVALTSEAQLTGKRLELIKETVPQAVRIAVLAESRTANSSQVEEAERAARALGITLVVVSVSAGDYDRTFATMRAERVEALVVLASTTFSRDRKPIVALAARYRLPTIYDLDVAADGGLLSYGVDVVAVSQRAAAYIDRIFKGATPAELPVEQPRAFTLTVNLKTARALGLTIPPAVLARADEVIQ